LNFEDAMCPHSLGHKRIPEKSIFLEKLHLILSKEPEGPGAFDRGGHCRNILLGVRFLPNLLQQEKEYVVFFSKK